MIKKGTSYHVDYTYDYLMGRIVDYARPNLRLWLGKKTWARDGVAIGRNGVQYGEQASEPKSVNVTRTTL